MLHQDHEIVEVLYDRAQEWLRLHESYDIFAKRKIEEFKEHKGFTKFEEVFIPACMSLFVGRTDVPSAALLEGNQFERGLRLLEENQEFLKKETEFDPGMLYLCIPLILSKRNEEWSNMCEAVA